MILLGVDPHKSTHTATAVDPVSNQQASSLRIEASLADYRRLLAWGRRRLHLLLEFHTGPVQRGQRSPLIRADRPQILQLGKPRSHIRPLPLVCSTSQATRAAGPDGRRTARARRGVRRILYAVGAGGLCGRGRARSVPAASPRTGGGQRLPARLLQCGEHRLGVLRRHPGV